jgi:inorganic pyrophosphatase
MSDRFDVFIENPAGSDIKHHHHDKTQRLERTERVSRPYPYAYGFVIGTTSGDGDNLDCFVVTDRELTTGEIVSCVAVALLEQTQDGDVDHDVIAVPAGEAARLPRDAEPILREFIAHVFDHLPDKVLATGALLDGSSAEEFIAACRDH